jgi:hypothetical protein
MVMIETALVFDNRGRVIRFHLPPDRTGGSIPDSRDLWTLIWDYRRTVAGVAHTHPWEGPASPSGIDVTTWRAIEQGLGKLLLWPIVTFTEVRCFVYNDVTGGYEAVSEADRRVKEISGIDRLRELSRG